MSEMEALDVAKTTLFLILRISAPVLLAAMLVGVGISLIQTLTQIQESTLSFAPKIVAMFITLIICLPYMGQWLGEFSQGLFSRITGTA